MGDPTRGGRDPGYFGPGVIGSEQHEKEKEEVANLSTTFGPGVTGLGLPNQAVNAPGRGVTGQRDEPPAVGSAETPSLSITKLEEALEENPFILDGMIAAEFERAEGPRKAALRLLLKVEAAKAEPRAEVVDRLTAAVKGGA